MPKRLGSFIIGVAALAVLSAAATWQTDAPPPALNRQSAPRDPEPRYWKGNLHTHTLWSDGDDFPEMVVDWYKAHGYQFLALSEHNVLADGEKWVDAIAPTGPRAKAVEKYRARFGERWVERREHQGKAQVRLKPLAEFRSLFEEPGRFLLVPAEEITHSHAKVPVHLNAINLRDLITPLDGNSIADSIRVNHRAVADQRRRTGRPMLVFLNHPNYQWAIRGEDMILTEELRYFEIFNGHPVVRNYGDLLHPGCERMWDIVLALRLGKHRLSAVSGLATDDAHGYHVYGLGKVNPGRGWIMVRAPHLTAEAVIRAMEAGDFYATTGVVLKDVRRTADELRITIQPEPGVRYRTQFIATLRDAALDSEPRIDADGKPVEVTRVYGPDIGKIVAESESLEPSYRLTGKEWYVRGKVISTKPHPNPYEKGDVEVAWTQPVVP